MGTGFKNYLLDFLDFIEKTWAVVYRHLSIRSEAIAVVQPLPGFLVPMRGMAEDVSGSVNLDSLQIVRNRVILVSTVHIRSMTS